MSLRDGSSKFINLSAYTFVEAVKRMTCERREGGEMRERREKEGRQGKAREGKQGR